MEFHWPALITELVFMLLVRLAWNVGQARRKYKIAAPATSGHSDFERVHRVHMNTLENALVFLPALWLFVYYVNANRAGAPGGARPAARLWYAAAYRRDANKRGAPFGMAMTVLVVLVFEALFEIVKQLFRQ